MKDQGLSKRRRVRNRSALLAVAAASLLATGAAAQRGAIDMFFGDGGVSDFYRWDGKLSRPGVMLRAEPVGDGFYVDNAAVAQRILYSSTDGRFGRGVVEASGLLYLPRGKPPKGGWPLVVWGHGTMGIADVCAPSWKKPTPRDGTYVDAWLQRGFAVVAPDYQGLGTRGVHTYVQRKGEGYSTLDAARAALAAHRGVIANKVILTGQSQGSGAVLNATYLQPAYAPDVNLLGTIATALVWRANAKANAESDVLGPEAHRYYVMRMLGGGLIPGSPSPDSLLSAKGALLREAARRGCSRDLVPVAQKEGINGANAFTRPAPEMAAMLDFPAIPARPLRVPLLIATGLSDTTIPTSLQYAAVQAMCRRGNHIVWYKYDGVTHSGTSNFALRDAVPFAQRLLEHDPPASNCAGITPPGPIQSKDPSIPFQD